SVVGLIIIGILLVVAEVIIVPGTTLVGILGLLAIGLGIYLSFEYFEPSTSWWILGGSLLAFGVTVFYGFKSKTWERFSLSGAIESKVNEGLTTSLKAGDVGVAISALRPVGKAEFENKEYEVKSFGEYIEDGTEIVIVKIEINNIFVEASKNQES
ncbi:MAG: NfeD family protein, partial [Bacteroidota bacterium]